MSRGKILKFLRDTEDLNDNLPQRRGTVVIYTDSNDYSVGRHVDPRKPLGENIVWRCQEGLKTEPGIVWFKGEFNNLYIWLGTCDLTSRYIFLCSDYRRAADKLIRQLYLLSKFTHKQNFPLTLLEIPIFSLCQYNLSEGHHHPAPFPRSGLPYASRN